MYQCSTQIIAIIIPIIIKGANGDPKVECDNPPLPPAHHMSIKAKGEMVKARILDLG